MYIDCILNKVRRLVNNATNGPYRQVYKCLISSTDLVRIDHIPIVAVEKRHKNEVTHAYIHVN